MFCSTVICIIIIHLLLSQYAVTNLTDLKKTMHSHHSMITHRMRLLLTAQILTILPSFNECQMPGHALLYICRASANCACAFPQLIWLLQILSASELPEVQRSLQFVLCNNPCNSDWVTFAFILLRAMRWGLVFTLVRRPSPPLEPTNLCPAIKDCQFFWPFWFIAAVDAVLLA